MIHSSLSAYEKFSNLQIARASVILYTRIIQVQVVNECKIVFTVCFFFSLVVLTKELCIVPCRVTGNN